MSRRLRGQTTLQSLIGRSTITKKNNASQKARRSSAADSAGSAPLAPVKPKPKQKPYPGSNIPQIPAHEQPLPPGHAACPVCGSILATGLQEMNLHLDKCLAKQASTRGRNQSMISSYATKGKRAKLGMASSAPQAAESAASPTAAHGSPKRKVAGNSSPLRTRSGCIASPVQAEITNTQQHPSYSSTANGNTVETPFKSLSQEGAIRGRADSDQAGKAPANPASSEALKALKEIPKEGILGAMVPDTGRGGPASTSGGGPSWGSASEGLLSSKAGGVKFLTQAVGRRFNSRGDAFVGQAATLQHEDINPRDKNALILESIPPGSILGYLPRSVSQHLAPLVKDSTIGSHAVVLEIGSSSTAAVNITMEVWPVTDPDGPEGEEITAILRKAQEASRRQSDQLIQRSSSGTGEKLRANFEVLLDVILQQDSHLLSKEELAVIQSYREMAQTAQMLFLRLFLRTGPWFKLDTINYSECPDTVAAMDLICAAGLAVQLQDATKADRADVVRAMTIVEIQSLLATLELQPKKSGAKPPSKAQLTQLLVAALNSPSEEDRILKSISSLLGPCARLTKAACQTVQRLQRLFFLNEGQGLSHFLTLDLGFLKYPTFKVDRTRRVFQDRAHLLEYEQALREAAALDDALEREEAGIGIAGEVERALQRAVAAVESGEHKRVGDPEKDFLMHFSAAWVYATMATIQVSILEKQKRYAGACELLRVLLGGKCCPTRRGEWWVRLTLNLSRHLRREEEALETIESALADEWVKHGDRLDLQRRALRLAAPPRRWKVYPWASAAKREPREVRIVAQPLPNPLGLKSRFVCPDGDGECGVEQLALSWYSEEANGGWSDVKELSQIAECIGSSQLAAVCNLLAEDRSGWQGGMPDLLLWHPQRKAAKLSEVKGPRDNLSMQQRAWLNALTASGIQAEVLKVVEPGTKAPKGRKKSA